MAGRGVTALLSLQSDFLQKEKRSPDKMKKISNKKSPQPTEKQGTTRDPAVALGASHSVDKAVCLVPTMPVKSGLRLRSPSAITLRNHDEHRGETGTWKYLCDVLERGNGHMKRFEC